MNKFQFIKELLDTKKFNSHQKERFFKLVSFELANVDDRDQKIHEDIQLIKDRLGIKDGKSPIKGRLAALKEETKRKKKLENDDDGEKKDAGFMVDLDGTLVEVEVLNDFAPFDVKALIGEKAWNEMFEDGNKLSKLKNLQNVQINPIKEKKKLPEPNPKHVADFMSLFNQRDGLKYLTHDYDENSEFEIDKFLISAKKVFNDTTKKLNIPQSLWRIVKQFAFDSKQTEWTSISEDYKKSLPRTIGWASKELRNWSKKNHLHPIRNEEYEKIINDFKRITRIESSNLEKLIDTSLESVFEKEIVNYDIKKVDLSKADFYSHIGFLKIALETIFEEIKKRSDSSDKKKITFNYERSISAEGYYVRKIQITHYNSFPSKELEVLLKEWHEKGNMGKIKEKLRGYCHWSVETIIEESPIRVNILKEKESQEYDRIIDKPNGFTHLLTFYYK